MSREVTLHLNVPADHPCLAGHFPGAPIVPAVVLLDLAAGALLDALLPATLRVARVSVARFVSPWLPDEPLLARVVMQDDRKAQVHAAVGQRLIATFSLDLADA